MSATAPEEESELEDLTLESDSASRTVGDLDKKQVLIDLERAGGRTRTFKQAVAKTTTPGFYNDKSFNRKLGRYINRPKKSDKSYLAALHKLGVPIVAEATRKAFARQQLKDTTPNTKAPGLEAKVSFAKKSDTNLNDMTDAMGNMGLNDEEIPPPPPPSSGDASFLSPPPIHRHEQGFDTPIGMFSPEITRTPTPRPEDGTKRNPYRVPFNAKFPERHHMFKVKRISMALVEGKYRDYFLISCNPTIPGTCTAVIPNLSRKSDLYKRCVRLRVAADVDDDEQVAEQRGSCAKLVEFNNTAREPDDSVPDDEVDYMYYLLIFPEGTVLDNAVLSGSDYYIEKQETTIEIGEEHTVNSCSWSVCVAGGKRPKRRAPEPDHEDERMEY